MKRKFILALLSLSIIVALPGLADARNGVFRGGHAGYRGRYAVVVGGAIVAPPFGYYRAYPYPYPYPYPYAYYGYYHGYDPPFWSPDWAYW